MLRYNKFIALLLITSLTASTIKGEYYSSVEDLTSLFEVELHLADNLVDYAMELERRTKEIRKFLDEIEELVSVAAEDPEEYYENPLNVFRTLKRIVVDWKQIHESVYSPAEAEALIRSFTELEPPLIVPTADDLQGATRALSLLQNTYALDTHDLANGVLTGTKYSTNLTASECFFLGRSLYENGELRHAIEWLTEARSRLPQQPEVEDELNSMSAQSSDVTVERILEYLAPAFFNLGNHEMAFKINNELLAYNANNKYGLDHLSLYEQKVQEQRRNKTNQNAAVIPPKQKSDFDDRYEKVCRRELQQTPAELRDLRCRYVHNNVPFCRIAPFKMEELSLDPLVAFYHEAIYEAEIEKILTTAKGTIKRSQVEAGTGSVTSAVRTSKNTWIPFDQNGFMDALGQRLVDITGLSLKTGEDLQVANYGIGGHYAPHYDFSLNPNQTYGGKGNRILTALFYISDVELGGATGFPLLRLAVPPIRRSMVIWYNLHESLEFDYRTKHAGCPVLKGSKWICNEWFHAVGQEFLRPCSLKRDGYKSSAYKS